MAMRLHSYLWENNINRTLIMSLLIVFWTLLIELYFLFWPLESLQNHLLLGLLYQDFKIVIPFLGTIEPFLDLFHIILWSLCFFFSWILYTMIKQLTNSDAAGIIEFVALILIFFFFIYYINNIFVAGFFILFSIGEFAYMYFALSHL
ncbi:MAG: hypothetical protein ACXAC7_15495 [Candidatus Hodarchaeales archaeon]|jgi:hypothetical protein